MDNSSGRCKEIVIKLPDFLDLFIELMRDFENVEREERKLISCAVAYVLSPYDVIPEKKERDAESGFPLKRIPAWAKNYGIETRKTEPYLDDIFLCLEVFSRLEDLIEGEIIMSAWDGDGDVLEIAQELREELKEELDDETRRAVIEYAGLKKRKE